LPNTFSEDIKRPINVPRATFAGTDTATNTRVQSTAFQKPADAGPVKIEA
jgi:hypothetical protein